MDSAVDRRVGGQARKCRDFGQDRSKDIGRAARWGDLVGDPQPVEERGKPPLMRVPEVGVTAQRGDVRCGDAGQAVTPVFRAQRRSGIRPLCRSRQVRRRDLGGMSAPTSWQECVRTRREGPVPALFSESLRFCSCADHSSFGLSPVIPYSDHKGALSTNAICGPLLVALVFYSLSSSHSAPSVLRSSCAFARGTPLDPGRLRRPWETSNSPKPSRGFQPEKGRFRPPLSSPLAGSSFATPPAPPGSLSGSDQRGGLPLSGHTTARTIRHLSLHPVRRLRR